MKNKDDFSEVADQCYEITLMVWQATKEAPQNDRSDSPLMKALNELGK